MMFWSRIQVRSEMKVCQNQDSSEQNQNHVVHQAALASPHFHCLPYFLPEDIDI